MGDQGKGTDDGQLVLGGREMLPWRHTWASQIAGAKNCPPSVNLPIECPRIWILMVFMCLLKKYHFASQKNKLEAFYLSSQHVNISAFDLVVSGLQHEMLVPL